MPAIIAAILAIPLFLTAGLTFIAEAFTALTAFVAQLVNFLNPWILLINAINGFLYMIDGIYELFTSLSS
jgi:hypothetical protein